MILVLTRNCEIIFHLSSDNANEIKKEYRRIARNAWRRKSAFCQVEFPDKYKMSWREVPKRGEATPVYGVHHFYLELRERL